MNINLGYPDSKPTLAPYCTNVMFIFLILKHGLKFVTIYCSLKKSLKMHLNIVFNSENLKNYMSF